MESVLHRKICHKTGESFSCCHDIPFTLPLHVHEEYELIYITSGSGKEYIGDTVMNYIPGSLTLIGKNTPHLHLCNSCIKNDGTKSICHILQFPENIFSSNLSEIPELNNIYLLLKDCEAGIRFNSKETIAKILNVLDALNYAQGTERIILLYRILDILSKSYDREVFAPIQFQLQTSNVKDPIEKIYAYLHSRYDQPIDLNEIATYMGYAPASLCRFFKAKTNKTIFNVLNEIRIEHACRLLTTSYLTNAQIAYDCGFNNLSYFNKVFKSITQQTPTEYKNNMRFRF